MKDVAYGVFVYVHCDAGCLVTIYPVAALEDVGRIVGCCRGSSVPAEADVERLDGTLRRGARNDDGGAHGRRGGLLVLVEVQDVLRVGGVGVIGVRDGGRLLGGEVAVGGGVGLRSALVAAPIMTWEKMKSIHGPINDIKAV